MARSVMVLIDGLSDTAIDSLQFKTPLEHAKTPHMDSIAAGGVNGLLDPVEPGLACGSDTAHLNILGYDPRTYYRGRGAFESMGAGLDMIPGDIAFKCNFATLNVESNVVTSRRADRSFEVEGPILSNYLNGTKLPSFPDCEVFVKYATEHRCGVVVRGPNLIDTIEGTDPLKDNLPLVTSVPLDDNPDSARTAKLVNELSETFNKRLAAHPINEERKEAGKGMANIVLLRGCGALLKVPPFYERHNLKGFIIAPTCIIAGLAMSLSMDIVKAPGGTGDYHTNLESKGKTLVEAITNGKSSNGEDYDFGFLHIKAVDDAGHDKNVELKVSFLERIDTMIGNIIRGLEESSKETGIEYTISVTGDHSTPVLTGDHSYEPVPFAISEVCKALKANDKDSGSAAKKVKHESERKADGVHSFGERWAHKGALGRFDGTQVIPIVKNYSRMM